MKQPDADDYKSRPLTPREKEMAKEITKNIPKLVPTPTERKQ